MCMGESGHVVLSLWIHIMDDERILAGFSRLLDSLGIFVLNWGALKNKFGLGRSWKLELKVLESVWFKLTNVQ